MSRIAVVTDSTADVVPSLVESRGITVVPLTVILDGKGYLDGVEIQPDEFYACLSRPGASASTSQPTPAAFADAYARLLSVHDEVISVHISSKLSGTHSAAVQAAEEVGADRVHVVDSQLVSMPLALLVLAAAEMAHAKEPAAEVLRRLAEVRQAMKVYFMVATLEHLRRGGRIGAASALVGSVLQVKPVLTISDGQVAPLERVRTHDRALRRVIELASAGSERICAIIGHAAAPEHAGRIAEALDPITDTLIVAPLGPVVGAHAGPGTVGVGFYPASLCPLGLKLTGATTA
jgi:DegV family protein with EDD domain